jgi:putative hydrolase of the HAD superfamily
MRGMFFDLDDTLYPYEHFVESGFHAVARHLADTCGREAGATRAALQRARVTHRGRELQRLCSELQLPLSMVPGLLDVFRAHRPGIALEPAVHEMLRTIRRDGWRLAIVTNGPPAIQERKVEALGLATLVDHVCYADARPGCGKPHPAAFESPLQALGLSPTRTVHAGNDLVCDVLGARSAGLKTIHVVAHASPVAQRHESGVSPDAVVASVLEVPAAAAPLLKEEFRVV